MEYNIFALRPMIPLPETVCHICKYTFTSKLKMNTEFIKLAVNADITQDNNSKSTEIV